METSEMVSQDMNVGFAFLDAALKRQDAVALRGSDKVFSYGQLVALTVNMGRHMQLHGAGPGMTVGVASRDQVVVLTSIFATALIGARWIAAPPAHEDRLRAGIRLLLDSEPDAEERMPGAVQIDQSWLVPPKSDTPKAPFPGYADPDEVWMISRTSGTTGTPKMVGLSPRAVTVRNRMNADIIPFPGGRIGGLGPVDAPALLSRYLATLIHGGEIIAGPDPETMEQLGVDLVFGSPAQVADSFEDVVLDRRLPYIHLSGNTAHEALIRHLLKSFDVVANGYGSTEGFNCLSVRHSLGPDGELRRRTELREGVDLETVDSDGRPVPVGREGVVRVRNNVLANGYLDAPELTAEMFRDGWFYPGDLARWTAEGHFEVTGRTDDLFNVGGVKMNAAVLDYTMQGVDGVRDAVAFMMPQKGRPDRLSAFVSIKPGYLPDDVFAAIRMALLRLGGREFVPERFLRIDNPPRTRTGKPDRAGCVATIRAAHQSPPEKRE